MLLDYHEHSLCRRLEKALLLTTFEGPHLPSNRAPDGRPGPCLMGGGGACMNRTIKEATVRRYYDDSHDRLRSHLTDFLAAYNFAKRLKTLKGLTPYEHICKLWTEQPQRFKQNPIHHMTGLNILVAPAGRRHPKPLPAAGRRQRTMEHLWPVGLIRPGRIEIATELGRAKRLLGSGGASRAWRRYGSWHPAPARAASARAPHPDRPWDPRR